MGQMMGSCARGLVAACAIGLLALGCAKEAAEERDDDAVPAPAAGQAGAAVPPSAGIAGTQTAPPVTPEMTAGSAGAPPVEVQEPDDEGVVGAWCDVKQTLDERCIVCHDGQRTAGAPMALKTYDDLLAPAFSDPTKKVFELVGVRVHDPVRPMPPQMPLTAEQLAAIDAWVAASAPPSADPSCPDNAPIETPEENPWPDNCDQTYRVLAAPTGQKNTVAPGVETHPQYPVSAPWAGEEVQAIAWRAITDNPKVLHHWILYGPSRQFLFGWAPGKDRNEPIPDDVGVFLPSGAMTLDVHYNNLLGMQPEQDASGVEICVLKRPNFRPKTATTAANLTSFLINVPPGASDFDVTGSCTHTGQPVRLLSVSPHAHRTATHMRFTIERASGETVVMHDAAFNFEEQTTYPLDPPVVVESGDRIITTCTYTNDTSRAITFGENTGNEMCFNFALYEPMGGLNCGAGGGFPRF